LLSKLLHCKATKIRQIALIVALGYSGMAVADGYISNISTRAPVDATAENAMYAGFIVSGSGTKKVYIRAIGQGLRPVGVNTALSPVLELINANTNTVVAKNDGWESSSWATEIRNLPSGVYGYAPPPHPSDAAMILDLAAGSYIAKITTANNTSTGVGIVAVDEIGGSSTAKLVNVSTRAPVYQGAENYMYGGFIVTGGEREFFIRAVGKGLRALGVNTSLNPSLEIFDQQAKKTIFTNESWTQDANSARLPDLFRQKNGVTPDNDDAGMIVCLQPGVYSPVVKPLNNSSGVGIVAIDNLGSCGVEPPPVITNCGYPNGKIGEIYNCQISVKDGTGKPSFSYQISSGRLPHGLNLNKINGLISGTPTASGASSFVIRVTDSLGQEAEENATITISDIPELIPGFITVGNNGELNGCTGLQTALDRVKDGEEIRIQQGSYDCTGLSLSENKSISKGIKISGGWDSNFRNKINNPNLTIFDPKGKDGNIFEFGTGPVSVEILSFDNVYGSGFGAAMLFNGNGNVDNCQFRNNYGNEGIVYFAKSGKVNNSIFNGNYDDKAIIYFAGRGELINSSFSGNGGSSSGGEFGDESAVVYFNSIGIADNSTFESNYGGAIYSSSSNLEVKNSKFEGNASGYIGAAIYAKSAVISNSTFVANESYIHGVVYLTGTAHITDSFFSKNKSGEFGRGGALNIADGTLKNVTFTGNIVRGDGGAISGGNISVTDSSFIGNGADYGYGGAISSSSVNISNSIFFGNGADDGCGAISLSSNSTIDNVVFESNATSRGNGGAICSEGVNIIRNSVFIGNSSDNGAHLGIGGNGGAIYNNNPNSKIINSLFSGNHAAHFGGAIFNGIVINSTVVNNAASNRSGDSSYYHEDDHPLSGGGGFYGEGTITNSIFYGNDIVSSYNLNVTHSLLSSIQKESFGDTNSIDNPIFVSPWSLDYRLTAVSPALDIADTSVLSKHEFLKDDRGNIIDLDGNPRLVGKGLDLGAFERQ
jgi:hypothetical protein